MAMGSVIRLKQSLRAIRNLILFFPHRMRIMMQRIQLTDWFLLQRKQPARIVGDKF